MREGHLRRPQGIVADKPQEQKINKKFPGLSLDGSLKRRDIRV
jgi:hypothetical protein